MKWIKVNTVRQRNEENTIELYKVFDRCWTVCDLVNKQNVHPTFETIKEAKAYCETIKA